MGAAHLTEFLEFLKSQAILLVAISASITILGMLLRPVRAFLTRHRPSLGVITNPEALPASTLQAAQTALAAGDPALADGLFGEIAAKADGAAARAHFARGKIAEGALGWADAARHSKRAAGNLHEGA